MSRAGTLPRTRRSGQSGRLLYYIINIFTLFFPLQKKNKKGQYSPDQSFAEKTRHCLEYFRVFSREFQRVFSMFACNEKYAVSQKRATCHRRVYPGSFLLVFREFSRRFHRVSSNEKTVTCTNRCVPKIEPRDSAQPNQNPRGQVCLPRSLSCSNCGVSSLTAARYPGAPAHTRKQSPVSHTHLSQLPRSHDRVSGNLVATSGLHGCACKQTTHPFFLNANSGQ